MRFIARAESIINIVLEASGVTRIRASDFSHASFETPPFNRQDQRPAGKKTVKENRIRDSGSPS